MSHSHNLAYAIRKQTIIITQLNIRAEAHTTAAQRIRWNRFYIFRVFVLCGCGAAVPSNRHLSARLIERVHVVFLAFGSHILERYAHQMHNTICV